MTGSQCSASRATMFMMHVSTLPLSMYVSILLFQKMTVFDVLDISEIDKPTRLLTM